VEHPTTIKKQRVHLQHNDPGRPHHVIHCETKNLKVKSNAATVKWVPAEGDKPLTAKSKMDMQLSDIYTYAYTKKNNE
jgi:hypothetical protein